MTKAGPLRFFPYGLRGSKNTPGRAHENGDVESAHGGFKAAMATSTASFRGCYRPSGRPAASTPSRTSPRAPPSAHARPTSLLVEQQRLAIHRVAVAHTA